MILHSHIHTHKLAKMLGFSATTFSLSLLMHTPRTQQNTSRKELFKTETSSTGAPSGEQRDCKTQMGNVVFYLSLCDLLPLH